MRRNLARFRRPEVQTLQLGNVLSFMGVWDKGLTRNNREKGLPSQKVLQAGSVAGAHASPLRSSRLRLREVSSMDGLAYHPGMLDAWGLKAVAFSKFLRPVEPACRIPS